MRQVSNEIVHMFSWRIRKTPIGDSAFFNRAVKEKEFKKYGVEYPLKRKHTNVFSNVK